MHSECENDIKDGRVFLFNYNIFKNKWNTILQKSKDILSMLKKRVPTVKNQIVSDLFLFCASFFKKWFGKTLLDEIFKDRKQEEGFLHIYVAWCLCHCLVYKLFDTEILSRFRLVKHTKKPLGNRVFAISLTSSFLSMTVQLNL